ncbi:MAG: methyltransferase domain-containing protein, partial [Alphaproteobacteria bacterium]|nr:methyltransferase domain-containing protein [Alphaproteobacteria bacterium]
MWPDVVDQRDFYATGLGQAVRRIVRRSVRDIWPDTAGMAVAGIGYATPYLRPFHEEAARTLAVMPAPMGVIAWPAPKAVRGGPQREPNIVALAREAELPLPDLSVDRILMVHALEHVAQPQAMLRELWRVLADGGRLLAVVPNRRSIWARSDHTPFGHGQPYSLEQLNHTLRAAMFAPLAARRALFMPPTRQRFVLSGAYAWERIGARW